MAETRGSKLAPKTAVLLGFFFGLGFLAGFLAASRYDEAQFSAFAPRPGDGIVARLPDETGTPFFAVELPSRDIGPEIASLPGEALDLLFDSELVLEEHELGEDENGLFIYGTIFNRSSHPYDTVRVAFDLCDDKGQAYSGITDITRDRMAPGDSWGFTMYIPYSDMDLFSSYRLQSIIGATK
ncbi:MAG: FxLYD domain-containing protein [Synergistaceae bacterium]|nr:FxLYD domain-containing protein [Synergistaceae bacterium]